jgi:hypothetical protein
MNMNYLAYVGSFEFAVSLSVVFWTAMIFISIAWYGFLLFYIGVKGGHEIKAMIKALSRRDDMEKKP